MKTFRSLPFTLFSIVVGIAVVTGLVAVTPAIEASAKPEPKVYVCKYVGTPGTNERLQTGQNPILVNANSTGGAQVGEYFNDQHGRSFVIALDDADPEPTIADCPGYTPPPPDSCPAGTHGTPPNCIPDSCPAGTHGTPPDCVPNVCPEGQTGTWPNCTSPGCPEGQVGTPPNCYVPTCEELNNCPPPPEKEHYCLNGRTDILVVVGDNIPVGAVEGYCPTKGGPTWNCGDRFNPNATQKAAFWKYYTMNGRGYRCKGEQDEVNGWKMGSGHRGWFNPQWKLADR